MPKEIYDCLILSRKALDVVKSRFLLCILVSQRVHQLEKGAQPTIEVEPNQYTTSNSYFELALREIIDGNMDLEQISEEV